MSILSGFVHWQLHTHSAGRLLIAGDHAGLLLTASAMAENLTDSHAVSPSPGKDHVRRRKSHKPHYVKSRHAAKFCRPCGNGSG